MKVLGFPRRHVDQILRGLYSSSDLARSHQRVVELVVSLQNSWEEMQPVSASLQLVYAVRHW